MIPCAKIPYTSVLRERERTIGGLAEPNTAAAAEIVARVRKQLGSDRFAVTAWGSKAERRAMKEREEQA